MVAAIKAGVQVAGGAGAICSTINAEKLVLEMVAVQTSGYFDYNKPWGGITMYGPLKLPVATVKVYGPGCGYTGPLTDSAIISWLIFGDGCARAGSGGIGCPPTGIGTTSCQATKVKAMACITTQYLKTLVGSCGCDFRRLAVAYESSSSVCSPSANCTGCIACTATETNTVAFECPWSDPAHMSVDEVTYSGLRKSSSFIGYCYANVPSTY
jgi:hypothetical protein